MHHQRAVDWAAAMVWPEALGYGCGEGCVRFGEVYV